MDVSREKLLLTEVEAAKQLQFSPAKLAGLRKAGKIGYLRSGRLVRYRIDDLTAWIAAHAQGVRIDG